MKINFSNISFETSFGKKEQLVKSIGPEFVFSGKSNVGKSSLINKIFNRKHLAKVSSTPGKTSTINFYKIDNVRFIDLPGYGYAKISKQEKYKWKSLVSSYLYSGRDINLIFQLIDIRHKPSQQDLEMINFFIQSETPFVIILTKADKLTKTQKRNRLNEFIYEIPYGSQIKMISASSITGEGISTIQQIITNNL